MRKTVSVTIEDGMMSAYITPVQIDAETDRINPEQMQTNAKEFGNKVSIAAELALRAYTDTGAMTARIHLEFGDKETPAEETEN